ncbi:MAG: hypothetical protein N3F03_02130 [Ignavibacteria bacterium]|nr:hypothetical protein [Ignavibacteria bacterium]
MKFVRLALLLLSISLILFSSCGKEKETPETSDLLIDSTTINLIEPYSYADSVLMKKVLLVYLDDSLKSFNGIFEDDSYGIGFFVLKPLDTSNVINFKSELLDGIGDGAEVDTITLMNKKFLYYNSGSAFIGSRNLEIYQYLFEPLTKSIYKSYTALSEDGSIIQTYSQNLKEISKNDLVSFFMNQIQTKYIDDISERKLKVKYE